MKVDILAFGAHPDDVELACSGTVLAHVSKGYKVGIVDLSAGELGTRGSAELRLVEANNSAKILGVEKRVNLGLSDGFFEINEESMLKVVEQIRYFRPEIILCNSVSDRHPDHSRGGDLVSRANFISGLRKVETRFENENQDAWRAKVIYRYIQDRWIEPDIVVDISEHWEDKLKVLKHFLLSFTILIQRSLKALLVLRAFSIFWMGGLVNLAVLSKRSLGKASMLSAVLEQVT